MGCAVTDNAAMFRDIEGAVIRPGEPMSAHTTLGIGGPAELFITPRNVDTLAAVIKRASALSVMPLGGGSNVLVSDAGIDGVVLDMGFNQSVRVEPDGSVIAGAGVPLQRLINLMAQHGLSGIEGLSGIPGQLGGAIAGNAGSCGMEIKDVVASIAVMDADGNVRVIEREGLEFGYRHAALEGVLIGASLRLTPEAPEAIRQRMAGHLERKKLTQPVADKSAGCVFKNPEGHSAGQLIDTLGLKGRRVGDIEVSPVHANFFVNRGRGSAGDYKRLMDYVTERVYEATGVVLVPEIRMVGRWQ